MFIGHFTHTLDDKSRIALPAKFRTRLEEGVVMTTGRDKQILIFSREEFDKFATKVDELPILGMDVDSLRRFVFGNAVEAVPDKQGRVIISAVLLAHAAIEREAVLVGVGKFIEMWNPEEWQRAKDEVAGASAQKQVWAQLGI
jgi:MraZ protein